MLGRKHTLSIMPRMVSHHKRIPKVTSWTGTADVVEDEKESEQFETQGKRSQAQRSGDNSAQYARKSGSKPTTSRTPQCLD
jgi:hypothetical protein